MLGLIGEGPIHIVICEMLFLQSPAFAHSLVGLGIPGDVPRASGCLQASAPGSRERSSSSWNTGLHSCCCSLREKTTNCCSWVARLPPRGSGIASQLAVLPGRAVCGCERVPTIQRCPREDGESSCPVDLGSAWPWKAK